MKNIIIVGAGGFGREALTLIKSINKASKKWNIKGFINDIPDALDNVKCNYKIIGTIKDWVPSENEVFAMGIASPKGKEKVASILKDRGAKFETLISMRAFVGDYVEIGEGCVITGGSTIGSGTIIGDFVNIASSMVGQDAIIGDYSTTTGYANITNAHIGKRVFVGSQTFIMNKKKIGDDAFISAGSIVFNNVKAGTRVIGNPARKFKL